MRKTEREIKNFMEIAELARRCDTIRLGITDEKAPYVVPVSFGIEIVDNHLCFYFHGAKEGRRTELLERHPYVCVEGDLMHGYSECGGGITSDYESFIGYGKAEQIEGEEALRGLNLLLEHCGYQSDSYPNMEKLLPVTGVYRIILEEVSGKRRFKH